MKRQLIFNFIILSIINLSTSPIWAQFDPPGDEDPAAPINDYLIWLILTGVIIGFIFTKRFKNIQQS